VSALVESPKKVWTEAELKALPDDGFIHELVGGELVMSPKNSFFHGDICMRLSTALNNFVIGRNLGVVLDSSTGFWMRNRNCRAPDISFVTKARLIALGVKRRTRTFFPGAPDLAIEILSPHNTRAEIDRRLTDFFASGSQIAWVINPETDSVEICHSPIQRQLLGPGAELDGEHLLPGFRYPIADLFKDWDWE
jgi:Uma2 family endonuclease